MSKDLYKNSLLVVLLLFFYYKQKEDIDVYLNVIMHKFNNIKYVVNNYLSIILNNKNKKNLKKKIDYLKSYFLKKNSEKSENLDLKEEYNIVEIILPTTVNIEDTNIIDLKKTKKSYSIFNILLNKYVILSLILAINYYKRKFINKPSINSNKKSDELDIFNNDDIKNNEENKKKHINNEENYKINEDKNIDINEDINSDEDENNINKKDNESINSDEDENNINEEDDTINNKIIL
jgi:hypothetical protein